MGDVGLDTVNPVLVPGAPGDGRGTCDMKAGEAAMVIAAEARDGELAAGDPCPSNETALPDDTR